MSGTDVNIAADGATFSAYLATPAQPKGPAIVVLQEIFGVNANIRSIADDFASQGYYAIAPDLFWRQQPGVQLNPALEEDRNAAMAFMKGMDQSLAVADAKRALDYASTQPGANGRHGAVGYCLGGKISFLLAATHPIDAAISYYGVAIQDALDKAGAIKGALLLHIAGADHLCPPEAQAKIIDAVKVLGERAQIETYEGAGHAFARRGGQPYVADAATRADAASARFFTQRLGA
jgi:carboxymethylenebutenolidase